MRGAARFLARAGAARRGGVALITALALPPLLIVGLGAVQLQSVYADKARTQDVADAAALWGAAQLSITPKGVDQRTIAWANVELEKMKANAVVDAQAAVLDKRTIKVTIDTQRDSFFMNLFPAGGFHTHVESTAEGLAQSPLCVLTMGGSGGDDLKMSNSAKLQAPSCLIHSNRDVKAAGSALIQADTVEASGGSSGPISPAASTGAPRIPDPFTGLPIQVDTALCLVGRLLPLTVATGGSYTLRKTTLLPHLLNIEISNGTTLKLEEGKHVFCGDVKLKKKAKMVGDGVTLVFGKGAGIDWGEASDISLNGSKSGPYAGFVIVDARDHARDFYINADGISNITGTIYVPAAKLKVDGSKLAGAGSAWTVVVAKNFEGINGANLMINDNYGSSTVPVPEGVGPRAGGARLTK